jgi:hypothetical protein
MLSPSYVALVHAPAVPPLPPALVPPLLVLPPVLVVPPVPDVELEPLTDCKLARTLELALAQKPKSAAAPGASAAFHDNGVAVKSPPPFENCAFHVFVTLAPFRLTTTVQVDVVAVPLLTRWMFAQ